MDAASGISLLTNQSYDNAPRWCAGDRLYDIFHDRVRELCDNGEGDKIALETNGEKLSYLQLSNAVDQIVATLQDRNINRNSRIGLILDRSAQAYVLYLAIVKIGAVYVPIDEKFPDARIAFIVKDASITHVIMADSFAERRRALPVQSYKISELESKGAKSSGGTPTQTQHEPDDELAYIIYTSGSTGQPKGVAINHSSICNFVRVACETYGLIKQDRVYQGLTFAFDFSVEEFWVPLASGSTLVASPSGIPLVGQSLSVFLHDKNITALCCVPTLLASLTEDVANLRWLLVSGEACPSELVARWSKPGRTLLNAYGPTEATVTATLSTLSPDRQVTIGRPLPTYTIAILDPETGDFVSKSKIGEITIAGMGLAASYINRDALTDQKFIPDSLNLANNPSGKLYKTGDLGRITPEGEIEYHGRIDTQVKLKGFRIELSEIESVLMSAPDIIQAAVMVWHSADGSKSLVAYVTTEFSRDEMTELFLSTLRQFLGHALPDYMVPTYIEHLDHIPMTPSQKIDREALPTPSGVRLTDQGRAFLAPKTDLEGLIARILAETLSLDQVSVNDHLFDDLGLDSLLAAQFLAAVASELDDGAVSIADVYQAPTVAKLCSCIEAKPKNSIRVAPATRRLPSVHVDPKQHFRCGVLQAIFLLLTYFIYIAIFAGGLFWIIGAETGAACFSRSILFVSLVVFGLTTVAVAMKWIVIGRWTGEGRPLWSPAYFCFWITRAVVESAPLAALRGSPLFNIYLKLLGAKVALNAVVLTRSFPLITDLLTISSGAVLRKDCIVTGYRAEGGVMRIGSIGIGRNAIVGENSLIDINTEMGDFSSLAHASALLEGEAIADYERRHGSPSESLGVQRAETPGDEGPATMQRCIAYAVAQLSLLILIPSVILATIASVALFVAKDSDGHDLITHVNVGIATIATAVALFVIGYGVMLFVNLIVPRLLRPFFKVGVQFPIYGVRYYLSRLMVVSSTQRALHILFGDSSFAVNYVRWLGIRQPNVQQTGSNFGTSLYQDDPFLCRIGSGTMISDDFSIINHKINRDQVRVHAADVGLGCFLGNDVTYPADARVGDNCLLASRVMVPTDGPVRENVGLLGSPAFEIPRNTGVEEFNSVPSTVKGHAQLTAKNRYNARTIALYLGNQFLLLLEVCLLAYASIFYFTPTAGLSVAAALIFAPVLVFLHFVCQERVSLSVQRFKKTNCTIHNPYFWWVERYWKFSETPLKYLFRGTPFRPVIFRLLGANIGRFVFDDGSIITEKPLTEIGDETCINAYTTLQAHSLEDGLYKADQIKIGDGCTLGTYSYVHYGTVLANGTAVACDAFIMKGTTTKQNAMWQGNPATSLGLSSN